VYLEIFFEAEIVLEFCLLGLEFFASSVLAIFSGQLFSVCLSVSLLFLEDFFTVGFPKLGEPLYVSGSRLFASNTSRFFQGFRNRHVWVEILCNESGWHLTLLCARKFYVAIHGIKVKPLGSTQVDVFSDEVRAEFLGLGVVKGKDSTHASLFDKPFAVAALGRSGTG